MHSTSNPTLTAAPAIAYAVSDVPCRAATIAAQRNDRQTPRNQPASPPHEHQQRRITTPPRQPRPERAETTGHERDLSEDETGQRKRQWRAGPEHAS